MSSHMSRRSENSLIGLRIQQMASQLNSEEEKDSSPTLKDLREKNPSRVKRFSEIFERKPWSLKIGCNWWLKSLSPKESPRKPPPVFEFPSPIAKFNGGAKMKKILEAEENHIEQLKRQIETITTAGQRGIGYFPMKLREYSFSLFADLKTIVGFHKIVILPQVKKSLADGSCVDFIKILIRLLDEDHFYCYVRHKMQERNMKMLHKEFLIPQGWRSDSFNLDHFKILSFYYTWISGVCDELMKHPAEHADDVAICIDAEKKLMDLLDAVADAEGVSHISQVADVPFDAQFKVLDIIKRHEATHQPMLLLVPRKSIKFGYRYPIDVLQLGPLKKSFEFEMTSYEHSYKNDAKFFVFASCIIYTTVVNKGSTFSYENNFWMKDVTFSLTEHNKMIAELVNCNHKVHVDNPQMLAMLMDLKMKHKDDEITAEVDMSEGEMMRLIDSLGDAKKSRRHSIIPS